MPGLLTSLDRREVAGIITAVDSVFLKLQKLHGEILPAFEAAGFRPPSAGVIARDLSEKIELEIIRTCGTFARGRGHADLARGAEEWEVKICRGSGLTINQSKQVGGESYIVANYGRAFEVRGIFVLWQAEDYFFSPRMPNSNARSLRIEAARHAIQWLTRRPWNAAH